MDAAEGAVGAAERGMAEPDEAHVAALEANSSAPLAVAGESPEEKREKEHDGEEGVGGVSIAGDVSSPASSLSSPCEVEEVKAALSPTSDTPSGDSTGQTDKDEEGEDGKLGAPRAGGLWSRALNAARMVRGRRGSADDAPGITDAEVEPPSGTADGDKKNIAVNTSDVVQASRLRVGSATGHDLRASLGSFWSRASMVAQAAASGGAGGKAPVFGSWMTPRKSASDTTFGEVGGSPESAPDSASLPSASPDDSLMGVGYRLRSRADTAPSATLTVDDDEDGAFLSPEAARMATEGSIAAELQDLRSGTEAAVARIVALLQATGTSAERSDAAQAELQSEQASAVAALTQSLERVHERLHDAEREAAEGRVAVRRLRVSEERSRDARRRLKQCESELADVTSSLVETKMSIATMSFEGEQVAAASRAAADRARAEANAAAQRARDAINEAQSRASKLSRALHARHAEAVALSLEVDGLRDECDVLRLSIPASCGRIEQTGLVRTNSLDSGSNRSLPLLQSPGAAVPNVAPVASKPRRLADIGFASPAARGARHRRGGSNDSDGAWEFCSRPLYIGDAVGAPIGSVEDASSTADDALVKKLRQRSRSDPGLAPFDKLTVFTGAGAVTDESRKIPEGGGAGSSDRPGSNPSTPSGAIIGLRDIEAILARTPEYGSMPPAFLSMLAGSFELAHFGDREQVLRRTDACCIVLDGQVVLLGAARIGAGEHPSAGEEEQTPTRLSRGAYLPFGKGRACAAGTVSALILRRSTLSVLQRWFQFQRTSSSPRGSTCGAAPSVEADEISIPGSTIEENTAVAVLRRSVGAASSREEYSAAVEVFAAAAGHTVEMSLPASRHVPGPGETSGDADAVVLHDIVQALKDLRREVGLRLNGAALPLDGDTRLSAFLEALKETLVESFRVVDDKAAAAADSTMPSSGAVGAQGMIDDAGPPAPSGAVASDETGGAPEAGRLTDSDSDVSTLTYTGTSDDESGAAHSAPRSALRSLAAELQAACAASKLGAVVADIVVAASRTMTGGDSYAQVTALFGHPGLVAIMALPGIVSPIDIRVSAGQVTIDTVNFYRVAHVPGEGDCTDPHVWAVVRTRVRETAVYDATSTEGADLVVSRSRDLQLRWVSVPEAAI